MPQYHLFWTQRSGNISSFEGSAAQPDEFLSKAMQAGISKAQWSLLWTKASHDWLLLESYGSPTLILQQPTATKSPALPTLAQATMNIQFHYRCGMPGCGKPWSIDSYPPSLHMTCPHCGQSQKVPSIDQPHTQWNTNNRNPKTTHQGP